MTNKARNENLQVFAFDQVELDDFYTKGDFPDRIDDRFNAECFAMLGAMKSRSSKGVLSDLNAVRKRGAKHFMETYYKNYGHLSIGQNSGVVGIYVEGCSMLAAKAIQDDLFYNGQETSTRYIPFVDRPIISPMGVDESSEITQLYTDGMALYSEIQDPVFNFVKESHPVPEGVTEKDWDKTLRARTFDITRSLLFAGTTTLVAWHGLIETLCRRVPALMAHPLEEVRQIAEQLMVQLIDKYPSSFQWPSDEVVENRHQDYAYIERLMHLKQDESECILSYSDHRLVKELIDKDGGLTPIDERGHRQPLPRAVGNLIDVHAYLPMDFGSWRDLQRHRMEGCHAGLLTPKLGFHRWYLSQMPDDVVEHVEDFLIRVEKTYNHLLSTGTCNADEAQYILPMGYKLQTYIKGDLKQMTYMTELRSGLTVHPTARFSAIGIGMAINQYMKDQFGIEQTCRLCMEDDTLTVKRGQQNIDGINDL